MKEEVAGGPTPSPECGQFAASGAADAPAEVVNTEAAPEWLEAATALLGRDPETGLMDTDRLLEMMSWQARQLFSHAKTDRSHHTKDTLLGQIQAAQSLINTASAVQHMRVAQYAATAESVDPGCSSACDSSGDLADPAADSRATPAADHRHREHAHELGQVCEFTDVDLAPLMCWGPFQATRRIDEAVDAVTKTPRLLDEMGAGRLDAARVAQVTWELLEAGDDTCAQVEDRLLKRGLTSWTSRQARNSARTLVRRVDPAAAKQTRTRRAKEQIGSFTQPGPETGLTEWSLVLPTEQALPAVQAVEDLARQLHQDTTTDKTLGECRVDAFCDLLLGNAEVQTTVSVLVPVKTATTPTGEWPSSPDTGDGPTTGGNSGTGDSSGSRSVADSWAETMMADYNWDAALQRLIIDLDHRSDDEPTDSETTGSDDTDISGGREQAAAPPSECHGNTGSPDTGPPDAEPPDPSPRNGDGSATSSPHQPEPPPRPARPAAPLCLPDVEIFGIGVIPADAVQDLIRTLGTRLTRSLVDWHTGTLVETGCESYRPTAQIRGHVLQRDQHCRFPGCERPAKFCDVDHVIAWPTGPTRVANLQVLCRHHHRAKHETRWQVAMTPDGICTWTSPSGRTYTTHPGSLEVTADLHVTPGPPEAPEALDLHESDQTTR